MKYFFVLLAGLLGLSASIFSEKTMLAGLVSDASTGRPLAGAHVAAFRDFEKIGETTADSAGQYALALAAGKYDVEISAEGRETRRVLAVPVVADQKNLLNLSLASSDGLGEVITSNYQSYMAAPHSAEADDRMSGGEVLSEVVVASTTDRPRVRGSRAPRAAKPAPASRETSSGMTIAAPSDSKAKKSAPAKRDAAPADAAAFSEEKEMAAAPMHDGGAPAPRAGLLTGGEWNDLHNWAKHWTDLMADGEIEGHMETYHFYPKHRYSVLLENENQFPAVDAEVRLVAPSGETVWQARTDNTGRAELWTGLFEKKYAPKDFQLVAVVGGKEHKLGAARPFSEGINRHALPFECRAPRNVDIVWAVDATGSMGDEIEYLKTELLDVIGRVKSSNPDLAVRMGTVFYRDQADDYLVRASGLSADIARTVGFIQKQYASGGGDYPEAVHSALEEAVFRQDWSREARARICFLLLDASPHQEPAVIESLQKSIAAAAKKGICLIPLAASGIQKDTEFLMKFFGLATNGTYTFLTDHSGIGGKHLEPTTDEYKVEAVNDLLVRIIAERAALETCEGKSSIRFDEQQAGQNGQNPAAWEAQFFPNPASQQFTLDLPVDADALTIYNAEGQAVRKLAGLKAGQTRIPVGDLPEGFYTLRILKGNQWQSGKLVVARS